MSELEPVDALSLLPPNEREFPSVALSDFYWIRRMRGNTSLPSTKNKMPRGRTSYNTNSGRDRHKLISTDDNKWHLYREINGGGLFSMLYGFTRHHDIRITLDGINQITVNNQNSNIRAMVWGDWNGPGNDNAEGWFFGNSFGFDSDVYLRNYRRGALYFADQVRIEYRNRRTNNNQYMCMDYLLESEVP